MQPQGIDLSGLKDIHLPDVPSVWPLPVTFWAVLLTLIAMSVLLRVFWVKIHKLTAKKYANQEVESITKRFSGNNYKIATELSLLMRRIALMKYPREEISGLSVKSWRQFLENTVKKPVFKVQAGDIIETVMFIPPERFKNVNMPDLIHAAKEWIADNT